MPAFDPLTLIGIDVNGATLGIVGMGRIGGAVATRASAADYVAALPDLLAQSDFLTLHCPLTPDTAGLIGPDQFAAMRDSAVLINTARGPIVDTGALTDALRSGRIAYAALDVTDPEPIPPDHPLVSMENVTLVPHIGSSSVDARRGMARLNVDAILAALGGDLPDNCVNADRIDPARWT